ncbi:histidine phosphatase family protein [Anaerosalibacter sp. Marseille-P3206]|uniref:histidine phosphatase family protein n=1 Tax=Anaerosalibacter sp. Marseille-P3206 TaxID=1871005 RepID=UPI000984970C|nr:histidine phosphatase family protein [Anaerosalibacter sp. Marseille-P3206]
MDVIFVRHGETLENKGRIYGSPDTSLSEKGKEQILNTKKIVESISFEKVYISPLKRTIETSKLLGLDGILEPRVKEINFGIFEGKTYEEIKREYPEETYAWTDDYINYRIPKGESLMDLYNRTSNFLEEVVGEDKDTIVVTHEGVIKCALCWVFDDIEYFYRFKVRNGSITTITINDGYKYIKL